MNKEFFRSKAPQKSGTQISMLTHKDGTTTENTAKILSIATNFYKYLLNVEMDGEMSKTEMDAVSIVHTVE